MPDYTPQLEIVRYVVMPDHLHILVRIKSTLERHLGRVVGGFMGGCTAMARKAGLIAPGGFSLPRSFMTESYAVQVRSRVW